MNGEVGRTLRRPVCGGELLGRRCGAFIAFVHPFYRRHAEAVPTCADRILADQLRCSLQPTVGGLCCPAVRVLP